MRQDLIQSMMDTFERNTIGFNSLIPSMLRSVEDTFPKFNVIKEDEEKFLVEVAVAGFGKKDINIRQDANVLIIEGEKEEEEKNYLFQGIANRAFRKHIPIATGIKVVDATIKDGILQINLKNDNGNIKQIPII